MALVLKDRVKESSNTTGTGTFSLGGAYSGFQSFSVIGNSNTTYYAIVNLSAAEWEVGIGTYTASGTTLSRDTILESSNSGSAVNFSAGTKDVFCTYPAEKAVTLDASNALIVGGALTTSGTVTHNGGTANGVAYLNGSKVLTTGSALTFDGAILGVNGVSVGRGAGAVATNTAVGASALAANSTSTFSTAVGYQALTSNTTAIGYNTALGGRTLYSNTTGQLNTAAGETALYFNTTGSSNTALGEESLQSNTTASNNTAVGYQAGYLNTGNPSNTSGSVFVGYQAGFSQTTPAAPNVVIGYQAGYYNQTGERNILIGWNAGLGTINNSYSGNVCIGTSAGSSLTTGSNNTFVGSREAGDGAGFSITSGSKNTIIGHYGGNSGGLDIRTASNYIVLSDGDGNPLISTANSQTVALKGAVPNSGTGITFPATQSASSNANTLDDYEEGTWTGVISGSTTAGTFTDPTNLCSYTKIGRQVTVQYYVQWESGTGTGNLILKGLPFTSRNASGFYYAGTLSYANVVRTASSTPATTIFHNTTQIEYLQIPTIDGDSTSIAYDAAGRLIGMHTYFTD